MRSRLEMPRADPYNTLVRSSFANPVHAGDLAEDYTEIARASSGKVGDCVELAAGLRDGVLESVRFRTFGCPHLIALCEQACAALQGRQSRSLTTPDMSELSRRLELPVEKSGLVILLEDALAELVMAVRERKNDREVDTTGDD